MQVCLWVLWELCSIVCTNAGANLVYVVLLYTFTMLLAAFVIV